MAKGKSKGASSGQSDSTMVNVAGRVQEVLTADGLLAVLGILPFDYITIPIALSVRWLWNQMDAEDPVKAAMDAAWAEANAAWASASSIIADAAQEVMDPMADTLNDDVVPALAAMNLELEAFQQQTGADAAQGAQSAMDALSPLIGILTELGELLGWLHVGFTEGLTAGLQENAAIWDLVAASAPLWVQVFDALGNIIRFVAWIIGRLTAALINIAGLVIGLVPFVIGVVSDALNLIGIAIGALLALITGIPFDFQSAFDQFMLIDVSAVERFIRERIGGAIRGAIDRLGDLLSSLGTDIVAGLIAGVTSAAPDFGQALAQLIPFGRRELEVNSPSRVAERELGVPIAEGIVEGIASMSAQMENVLGLPALAASGAGRTGSPIVVNQYFELADKSEQSLARAARRGSEQGLVTVWRRRGERA